MSLVAADTAVLYRSNRESLLRGCGFEQNCWRVSPLLRTYYDQSIFQRHVKKLIADHESLGTRVESTYIRSCEDVPVYDNPLILCVTDDIELRKELLQQLFSSLLILLLIVGRLRRGGLDIGLRG